MVEFYKIQILVLEKKSTYTYDLQVYRGQENAKYIFLYCNSTDPLGTGQKNHYQILVQSTQILQPRKRMTKRQQRAEKRRIFRNQQNTDGEKKMKKCCIL